MSHKLLLLFFVISASITFSQSPGNCLHFNGSTNNVSTTLPTVFNNISANDLTMEAWVYPEGNVFSRIVFAQFSASSFASLSISTGNVIYFYVNNVSSENTLAGLPANQWTHVACTWDASTQQIQIFFDGTLQATSVGGSSSTGSDNLMTIGSRTNNAQYFPGRIDELRIWDEVRTPCQIQSLMNSEFTVAQTNLVAYYNFNQGTAGGTNTGITTLPDFTTNYNGTLNGFGLSGTTSNWIASGANITAVNQSPGTLNGVDTQSSCGPITWIDGNTYAADNNSATHLLSGGSSNGCDSLVTLNFTYLQPATGVDVQSSCSPLLWLDGNTYSADNNTATYTYTGGAANSCDSVVTLDFTLLTASSGIDIQSSCGPFEWIDGNTYLSDESSATYAYVGGASNGCDSVVTLNLTVNSVDVGTSVNANVIAANAFGVTSYQWLDCDNGFAVITGETHATFAPVDNGNFAVLITDGPCSDTSACVAITTIGLDENHWGNSFKVYPNPSDGIIKVQFTDSEAYISAKLYTLGGKLVQQAVFSNSNSLEMTIDHPSGIYLLELTNQQGEKTRIRIAKN